jgi:hypothetical protein
VSFHAVKARPQVSYTKVTAAEVDGLRESLNGKPIELAVTELRDSSTNPSVFAPGTDKKNFSAYSAAAVGGEPRTRLYVVVRDDTDVSKRIQRAVSGDKLVVRGTAYTTCDTSALTILVDTFDLAGS